MSKLEIKLLGHFDASLNGRSIALGGPKQQALFAYLAFHSDKAVSRTQLITMFWGDRFDTQANQSLRQALFRLRRDLGDLGLDLLDIDGEMISLETNNIDIDLLKFKQEAESTIMADWQSAAARFDDLLAGLEIRQAEFDDWLMQARQQLELISHVLFDRLSTALRQADDFNGGLAIADKWIARDPMNEPAQRRAMEICAAAGDRAGALNRYQLVVELLRRELGVEPDPETQNLARRIRDGAAPLIADEVDADAADCNQQPSVATSSEEAAEEELVIAGDEAAARPDRALAKPLWLAAALLAIALIGVVGLWWMQRPNLPVLDAGLVTAAKSGKPSIAVLPFINMSNDEEKEYFADGMTDNLIADLSKVSGLTVISRNSVFSYKGKSAKALEVAKDLNVSHILEGSVRRTGGTVQIDAQLIDAATGDHLWAQKFDRDFIDIFKLQNELTQNIIAALELALTPAEKQALAKTPTDSVFAYEYYLKAEVIRLSFDWNKYKDALANYHAALRFDPNFVAAQLGLARALTQIWRNSWTTVMDNPGRRARTSATRPRRNQGAGAGPSRCCRARNPHYAIVRRLEGRAEVGGNRRVATSRQSAVATCVVRNAVGSRPPRGRFRGRSTGTVARAATRC